GVDKLLYRFSDQIQTESAESLCHSHPGVGGPIPTRETTTLIVSMHWNTSTGSFEIWVHTKSRKIPVQVNIRTKEKAEEALMHWTKIAMTLEGAQTAYRN